MTLSIEWAKLKYRMKKDPLLQNDYSAHILAKKWQEVLSGMPSVMFFSTEVTSRFHTIVTSFSKSLPEQNLVHYYYLSIPCLEEPYFPYLEIIREYIRETGSPIEMILDIAKAYPPQREIFYAYLSNKQPHRKDMLLLDEVPYEISQIQRTLLALLKYISRQKPLVIAIEGLRNAGPTLLNFILYIQKNCDNAHILFLYSYSRSFHWITEEEQERWDSFVLALSEKNIVYDILTDTAEEIKPNQNAEPSHDIPAEKLLYLARLNFYFLAFEEALLCGFEAYPPILSMSGNDSDAMQYDLLNILGDSYYFTKQYSQAILQYQAITDKAQRADNGKQLARSYRKTGFAYLALSDLASARRFSILDLKIIEDRNEQGNKMYAYFYAFYLSLRTSTNIEEKMYFILMEMLKTPDTKNMYAFFRGNSVLYSQYFDNLSDLFRFSDESIEYYQKNKNEFALASSYHKKAIMYSNNAQYKEAFALMRKSLGIRKKIGDPLYIVRTQNGLGYLHYLTGNYQKSFFHYKKSLLLLGNLDDFEENTATLYNLAMVYFVTGNYEQCDLVIDKILKIMYILNINYLPYHPIHDVYIIKAICSVKAESYAKALELMHKIQNEELTFAWKPRFLFSLLQGMLQAHDGNSENAQAILKTAPEILKESDERNTDILPVYFYEYAKILLAAYNRADANILIEAGITYCESIGSAFNVKRLQELKLVGPTNPVRYELSRLQVSLDTLVKLAKQEYVLGKLQNKMRDIRFINIIQTELMQLSDKTEVSEKLLKFISRHIPMEISVFIQADKKGLALETAQCLPETAEKELLLPFLQKAISIPGKKRFEEYEIAQFFPENTLSIKTLICVPVLQNKTTAAWLLLATQKKDIAMTNEDFEILMIAAGQVGVIFEKIDREKEILRLSYEDELSGLHNRHAMQAKIRAETTRIERTKNKNDLHFSVALIDLDNFKYYNDTFGHNIGDLIIKEFSDLLKETFREIDFIVRFGGDEFVILMPETKSADATIPLERIYTTLNQKKYLIPEMESKIGHKISIPVENLISCSVGLASYEQGISVNDSIEGLLQQADRALYEAKSAGKNRIHIWNNSPIG